MACTHSGRQLRRVQHGQAHAQAALRAQDAGGTQVKEPSDERLHFFIAKIYAGNATQRVLDQFRPLIIKAINQYINGQVNDRLQSALGEDSAPAQQDAAPAKPATTPEPTADVVDSDIITTEEEREGFNIVRAIAVSEVPPERIAYRDAESYFAVLLDDNNRKPIIRLHLNSPSTKFVTTSETDKTGTRHDIETVVDIYKVAEQIRKTIKNYSNTTD